MSPPFNEIAELTARVARIRKLCHDLDTAIGATDDWRTSVAQMKRDADEPGKALPKKR